MGPSQNFRSTSIMAGVPSPTATPPVTETAGLLTACAATSSYFLYAQHNNIICLQHDSLEVVRQFDRHNEDVMFITADNVSDKAGRMIVSYDNARNAIVWDLITGDEITHIASNEHIRAAAWMRNGNIAFGNSKGEVILFDPTTSRDTISRTIYDPITAIAPSADCRTFAIGYMNGSVLIASLQPTFVMLHTLSTSRAPSAIVTVAWHTSASRQPADMLATQTIDGDSCVWSVPKAGTSEDSPRVVRQLKRTDNWFVGPNWLSWSKNGRIVQFSENETVSYDVKTKRVTCDKVPTPDVVKGLAAYGPLGKLFTVGPKGTIQQYDLTSSVPRLIQNVAIYDAQHQSVSLPPPPQVPPPAPRRKGPSSVRSTSSRKSSTLPVLQESESEEEYAPKSRSEWRGDPLPNVFNRQSYLSGARSTTSRMSKRSRMSRRSESGATEMSFGSAVPSDNESVFSGLSSIASSVQPTPMAREAMERPIDLFPYTKARLSDMPYGAPALPAQKTADALRRNMLSVVFGWSGDVEGLIQDELSRHPPGSTSVFLLQKWLGNDNMDMSALMSSDNMSSSDWMFLALASMNAGAQNRQLGLSMVQKLLQRQEVHTAAAILIALGENNDAIEVYVSHKLYIEAIILACLLFPKDWARISSIVQALGVHAVDHQHRQVALRCFSSAPENLFPDDSDIEGPDEDFNEGPVAKPDLTTTPPSVTKTPVQKATIASPSTPSNRLAQKNQALKLITSFDKPGAKNPIAKSVPDEDNLATAVASKHSGVPFRPMDTIQPEKPQETKEKGPATTEGADIPLLTAARYQPEFDRRSVASKASRRSRAKPKAPPAAIQTDTNPINSRPVANAPYIDIFDSGNKLASLTSPPLTSQSMLTDDSAAESEAEGLNARLARMHMNQKPPTQQPLKLSTTTLAAHNAAYPSNSEMMTAVPMQGPGPRIGRSNSIRDSAAVPSKEAHARDPSRASARTRESRATRVTEGTQRRIGLVSRPVASSKESDRGGRPMERIRTTFHEPHDDNESSEDEFYNAQSRARSQRSRYESRSRREYDDRKYESRGHGDYEDRHYENRSRREHDDRSYDNGGRYEHDENRYDNRSRREYDDRQYENESRRGRRQTSVVRTSNRETSQAASVIRYTSRTRSPSSPLPMTPAELSTGASNQSTRDENLRGRSGGRQDMYQRGQSQMSSRRTDDREYYKSEKRSTSLMRQSPDHLQEERPRKEASRVRGRASSRQRDTYLDERDDRKYPEYPDEKISSGLSIRQSSRARESTMAQRSGSRAREPQSNFEQGANDEPPRRSVSRASSAVRGRQTEERGFRSEQRPEPQATSLRGGFAEHRRERSASRARSRGPARREGNSRVPLQLEDVASPAGLSPLAMPSATFDDIPPSAATIESSRTGKFSIAPSTKTLNLGLPSNPRAVIVDDDDELEPRAEYQPPEKRYVPNNLPKHHAYDESLGKAAALLQAGEQRAKSALDNTQSGSSSLGTSPDPEGVTRSKTTPPELQHYARPIGLGTDIGGVINMALDTNPKSQPPSPPNERDRRSRSKSIGPDNVSVSGSVSGRMKSPFERIRSSSRVSARAKSPPAHQELPPLNISGPLDSRVSTAFSTSSRIHPNMERSLAPGSSEQGFNSPPTYHAQTNMQTGGLI